MTKDIGRKATLLALFLAIGVAACDEEEGACILSYEQREECRPRTTASLCTEFGNGTGALVPTTRLMPVTDEDRDRFENVKALGGDVTGLVCQRLGYIDCRAGVCQRR
jgi:hypothetical protein